MKKLASIFKGSKNNSSSSTTDEDEKIKIRKKLLEKAICDWTAKDVSLWLKSIDLQEYCKEFEKMYVHSIRSISNNNNVGILPVLNY